MWLIVSSALLQHFVCSCDLSIFSFIILVRMACSWAAHIKLSVSRFGVPFRNHCHLSLFLTLLVCCVNCHATFLLPRNCSFLLLFLLSSIVVSWIGSIKSIFTDLAEEANVLWTLLHSSLILDLSSSMFLWHLQSFTSLFPRYEVRYALSSSL